MRGRIIPAAFLVLAMAAAACLPASRRDAHWAGGWQTAGVDARTGQDGGNAAAGKVLVEAVGSFVAGGPAEAQGRDGAGAQGTRSARTERPRFSRITIAPGKEANFSGSGPSGGEVTLRVNGKLVGTTRIDGNGKWQMTAPALGAGDHRVRLSVERSGDTGGGSTGGQEVRIAIPEGVRGSEIVAFEDVDRADVHAEPPGSGVSDVRIRDHAERLAREASREFDVFTDREQAAREERRRVAQSEEEASTAEDRRRERNGPLGFDPLAPVEEWFSQSARDYYDYVVPELAKKGPRQPSIAEKDVPPPVRPGDVAEDGPRIPALPDFGALAGRVQDWLREANRTYQDEVVVDLSRRGEDTGTREEEVARKASDAADRQSLQTSERSAERQETLDEQAMDVARRAVEAQRAAEARRRDEEERERQAALEGERRLKELLARRDAVTRSAEEDARIATARDKARNEEDERRAAERARAEEERQAAERARLEEERKQEEARKLEQLLAEQDAARKRAEEEKKQRDARLQAERERQLRLETERVAREAVERERQVEEERRREEAERRLRLAREKEAESARRDARLSAKFERADRIARLADAAGFGKKPEAAEPGRVDEQREEIALPERRREPDRGFDIADRDDGDRGRRRRAEQERMAVAERRRSREVDEGVEAGETIARRRSRAGVSGLGGPKARRRGSLKDRLETSVDDETGARLAGWRQWAEPIATGCKDRRAGRTIRVPGTYVVARGDTLWQISWRHYNNGELYRRIYRANRRKLRSARRIYPCQRIWLPRL